MTENIKSKLWGWATSVDDTMSRFDYVDRIIVFFFMVVTMVMLIFLLSQNLSPAEQTEISPAIELMSYIPLFFLVWPIIHAILSKSATYAIKRWKARGGSA